MTQDNQKQANKNQQRDSRIEARKKYYDEVVGKPEESLLLEKTGKKKEDTQNLLEREAERLSKLVANESNSIQVIKDCNKLMDDAWGAINKGPEVSTALSKFDQIKQRLIQAYDSRHIKLELFWGLFSLIFSFLFIISFVIVWFKLIPGQGKLDDTLWVCLACALWGGVGSVIDACTAMYTHFGRQDFDKHFMPWYFVHPFLGLAIGAVVYLVLQAGLLSISGGSIAETASANTTSNVLSANLTSILQGKGPTGAIGVTALPIAIAFLGGFRQSAVINFFVRLVGSFFPQTSIDTDK